MIGVRVVVVADESSLADSFLPAEDQRGSFSTITALVRF